MGLPSSAPGAQVQLDLCLLERPDLHLPLAATPFVVSRWCQVQALSMPTWVDQEGTGYTMMLRMCVVGPGLRHEANRGRWGWGTQRPPGRGPPALSRDPLPPPPDMIISWRPDRPGQIFTSRSGSEVRAPGPSSAKEQQFPWKLSSLLREAGLTWPRCGRL